MHLLPSSSFTTIFIHARNYSLHWMIFYWEKTLIFFNNSLYTHKSMVFWWKERVCKVSTYTIDHILELNYTQIYHSICAIWLLIKLPQKISNLMRRNFVKFQIFLYSLGQISLCAEGLFIVWGNSKIAYHPNPFLGHMLINLWPESCPILCPFFPHSSLNPMASRPASAEFGSQSHITASTSLGPVAPSFHNLGWKDEY